MRSARGHLGEAVEGANAALAVSNTRVQAVSVVCSFKRVCDTCALPRAEVHGPS